MQHLGCRWMTIQSLRRMDRETAAAARASPFFRRERGSTRFTMSRLASMLLRGGRGASMVHPAEVAATEDALALPRAAPNPGSRLPPLLPHPVTFATAAEHMRPPTLLSALPEEPEEEGMWPVAEGFARSSDDLAIAARDAERLEPACGRRSTVGSAVGTSTNGSAVPLSEHMDDDVWTCPTDVGHRGDGLQQTGDGETSISTGLLAPLEPGTETRDGAARLALAESALLGTQKTPSVRFSYNLRPGHSNLALQQSQASSGSSVHLLNLPSRAPFVNRLFFEEACSCRKLGFAAQITSQNPSQSPTMSLSHSRWICNGGKWTFDPALQASMHCKYCST